LPRAPGVMCEAARCVATTCNMQICDCDEEPIVVFTLVVFTAAVWRRVARQQQHVLRGSNNMCCTAATTCVARRQQHAASAAAHCKLLPLAVPAQSVICLLAPLAHGWAIQL
jgi:hypothetical protein